MTDKQIIIDGVDVSGCKCYNPNIKMNCLLYPLQSDACENKPNCHYKLYKRKEQECEELKEELKLFQQLKDEDSFRVIELSTENVKLKHQLDPYKNTHKTEQNRRRAFEQTLEEIRKMVEKEFCRHKECCEFCAISNDCLNQKIIEKINEVENAHTL